ncbi:hypothetical protein K458DRAFT_309742, partial [Lentithecium fluviatile CBS 122367]
LITRTLYRLQTLELTHIIYIKGFLISVLELARCYIESLYFNSSCNVLYIY